LKALAGLQAEVLALSVGKHGADELLERAAAASDKLDRAAVLAPHDQPNDYGAWLRDRQGRLVEFVCHRPERPAPPPLRRSDRLSNGLYGFDPKRAGPLLQQAHLALRHRVERPK